MFKPSTRTRSFTSARTQPVPGFAETQFLHAEDDEDYSGFAPTQMFDDAAAAPVRTERRSTRRDAPARSHAMGEESAMPASWVTSRWDEEQAPEAPQDPRAHGAKAHQAADQARAVIEAQRRAEPRSRATPASDAEKPAGWMRRVRMAVQRVLPVDVYSVLPLFICVSLTMALISAVLPLFDKP